MLFGTAFAAASLLLASPVAAEGPVKAAKAGVAICMAHVRDDAVIFSFGGKGTTDVTAVRNDFGMYTVTCTGKYPENGDRTDLIINATAEASVTIFGLPVAGAVVPTGGYTTTQIKVDVFTALGALFFDDRSFFITIFLGREP